jgi:hypothetical protein
MVLAFNQECGGVNTKPASNGTVATVQNYAQATTNCSMQTKIDYNWINELIENFNRALIQAGLTPLPNDPDALKKIVQTLQAVDTTNSSNIVTLQTDVTALESDVTPLKKIVDLQGINYENDDLYTLADKDFKKFFIISAFGGISTPYTQELQALDSSIAWALTDAIGTILMYVDMDGGLHFTPSSATEKTLFLTIPDYFSVMGKGQSNMFASGGDPIGATLTKSFTHDNGLKVITITSGVVAQSPDTTAIEAFEGTDTGDTALENILTGVCYYLEKCGIFNSNQNIFAQNSGLGGASIFNISKGTIPYNAEIAKLNQVKAIAGVANKGLTPNVICFSHGETDTMESMNPTSYRLSVEKLRDDTSFDFLGSNYTLPFISHQMAGYANYTQANRHLIPMMQYEMNDLTPFYSCACPAYMMRGTDDVTDPLNIDEGSVHIDEWGRFHVGLFMGRAIEQMIRTKEFFKPLQPTLCKKYGARTVIVDFYVPFGEVELSTETVPNTADGFYGFELWVDGVRKTLSSVTKFSANQIKIVSASDLTGTLIEVAYAYSIDSADYPTLTTSTDGKSYTNYICGRGRISDGKKGTRGCLRDGATFIPEITILDNSTPYDGHNYCVMFKKQVEV